MDDLISNATILISALLSISLHSLQTNKTSCANTSQISIFSVLILVLMSILHAYLGLYVQLFLSFHTIRLVFFCLLCFQSFGFYVFSRGLGKGFASLGTSVKFRGLGTQRARKAFTSAISKGDAASTRWPVWGR